DQIPARITRSAPLASLFLTEVIAALLEKDPRRRLGPAARVAEILAGGEASAWWRDRSARELGRGGAPPAVRALSPPLVDREEELRVMFRTADDALRGVGGIAIIEGEPGSGKTRIAAELGERLGRLSATPLVLWGGNGADFGDGARGAVQQA